MKSFFKSDSGKQFGGYFAEAFKHKREKMFMTSTITCRDHCCVAACFTV